MKIQSLTSVSFCGQPENFAQIDSYLSRSAQPKADDFRWLKDYGVSDIINFRTMKDPCLGFDEKELVESLGMRYHNIPSVSAKPSKNKVIEFINLTDKIIQNNGKAHIHCKAGADRTGMYSFIYKCIKGIGSAAENKSEWIAKGLHTNLYPDLIQQTENLLKRILK